MNKTHTPQNIHIRKASINDYETLVSLWKESGLPYKPGGRDSKTSIDDELKKGISCFLIAEAGDEAAGTILVTHDGRKGWINRLAVKPSHRKKGIAKILVNEAEKILDDLGIGIIACLIEDYNQSSLEVFKKLGYVEFEGMHYLTKRKFPEI